MVRLLLANDHEIVLRGLEVMLAPFASRVDVVGKTTSDHEVHEVALRTRAHVVLLDAFLRRHGGLDAAAALLGHRPPYRVVIFTFEDDPGVRQRVLDAGVAGYLLKSLPAERLVRGLERVAEGEVVVDPALPIADPVRSAPGWPGAEVGLTQRESEVLALLMEGCSNRQIAQALFVSEETVKTHVRALYRKLGVSDRASATSAAWRRGIFPV